MQKQIDEVMGLVDYFKGAVDFGCPEDIKVAREDIESKLRELLPLWQPIETAPKTRKAILVWCPARKNEYIVSWDDRDSGDWSIFGAGNYLTEEPSHWMPLPKAPE